MDLETAKELDLVLNLFKKEKPIFISINKKFEELDLKYNQIEYTSILKERKLVRKLVESVSADDKTGRGYYELTFKGKLFNGFEKEINDKKKDRLWNKIFEWVKPIAASLLGVLLGYYLKSDPVNNVNVKVDSPKYYGVDTIYLLNQTAKVDTSCYGEVKINFVFLIFFNANLVSLSLSLA